MCSARPSRNGRSAALLGLLVSFTISQGSASASVEPDESESLVESGSPGEGDAQVTTSVSASGDAFVAQAFPDTKIRISVAGSSGRDTRRSALGVREVQGS